MTHPTRKLTMAQAISEAIGQEMERDAEVFVLGEDVGKYGGIFGATGGLLDKFGKDRIMDTPISETGFIGAAIGAAAEGMRPIAELMFVDFFGVCMDMIYNHMAKNTYMAGGNIQLPMVLMTAIGQGTAEIIKPFLDLVISLSAEVRKLLNIKAPGTQVVVAVWQDACI